MRHTYSEQEFREAIKTSTSISQVLKKLNILPAGGNYQTTHKRIKKLNIDTSHFTGQLWHKGKVIGPNRNIQDYLSNEFPIRSYRLKRRLLAEGFKEHKCELCGITEWNGRPAPIELDHINGNREDNHLENLRILCPNCHAQTDTYRGKNIKPHR